MKRNCELEEKGTAEYVTWLKISDMHQSDDNRALKQGDNISSKAASYKVINPTLTHGLSSSLIHNKILH